MKFFAIVLAVLVAIVAADNDKMVGSSYGGSSYGGASAAAGGSAYAAAAPAAPAASYGAAPASYGGSYNIPAPPCPKNYLFGCHPQLRAVPCSAPAGYGAASAGGYGSAGAYSHYVPQVAVPTVRYAY